MADPAFLVASAWVVVGPVDDAAAIGELVLPLELHDVHLLDRHAGREVNVVRHQARLARG